jgi:hypothetical protein
MADKDGPNAGSRAEGQPNSNGELKNPQKSIQLGGSFLSGDGDAGASFTFGASSPATHSSFSDPGHTDLANVASPSIFSFGTGASGASRSQNELGNKGASSSSSGNKRRAGRDDDVEDILGMITSKMNVRERFQLTSCALICGS